jgi:hypothetical protein
MHVYTMISLNAAAFCKEMHVPFVMYMRNFVHKNFYTYSILHTRDSTATFVCKIGQYMQLLNSTRQYENI